MKNNGPKAKRCRRQGMNLFGSDKYDKILQRKPYGPGRNAKTRVGRPSEYARQLLEKQKVRDIYGLSERQFGRVYDEATASRGQTGETIKQLLERRLDNVLYRAGFAATRLQARQFAGHGLFLVNGKRVTIPSYRMKIGDVITVRAQAKDSPILAANRERNAKYTAPAWLKVETAALKADVTALPRPEDAEQAVDMRQVVEFYSRT